MARRRTIVVGFRVGAAVMMRATPRLRRTQGEPHATAPKATPGENILAARAKRAALAVLKNRARNKTGGWDHNKLTVEIAGAKEGVDERRVCYPSRAPPPTPPQHAARRCERTCERTCMLLRRCGHPDARAHMHMSLSPTTSRTRARGGLRALHVRQVKYQLQLLRQDDELFK